MVVSHRSRSSCTSAVRLLQQKFLKAEVDPKVLEGVGCGARGATFPLPAVWGSENMADRVCVSPPCLGFRQDRLAPPVYGL